MCQGGTDGQVLGRGAAACLFASTGCLAAATMVSRAVGATVHHSFTWVVLYACLVRRCRQPVLGWAALSCCLFGAVPTPERTLYCCV